MCCGWVPGLRARWSLQDLLIRNLAAYDEFDAAARDADDAGLGAGDGGGAHNVGDGRSGGSSSGAVASAGGGVPSSAGVGTATSAPSPVLRSLPSVGSSAQLMRAFSQLGSGERDMLSPQARRRFGGLHAQGGPLGGPDSDTGSALMETSTADEEEDGYGMDGDADEGAVYSADELQSL